MLRAKIETGGVIRLPEPLHSYFGADDTCEVAQYRDHLALWRRWERKPRLGEGTTKVVHREAFARAAERHAAASRALLEDWPEVAMYLAGFAVECKLKELVCLGQSTVALDDAARSLSRRSGEDLDLTGSRGHDLALLWHLAGLQADLADAELQREYAVVNRWQVAWRYGVAEPERRSAATFLNAVDRVLQHLRSR